MDMTQNLSNVETFIRAYLEWAEAFDTKRKRTPQCAKELFGRLLCCPVHLSLLAEQQIFKEWARYFDHIYHLTSRYEQEDLQLSGERISLLSRTWFERLAFHTNLTLPSLDAL